MNHPPAALGCLLSRLDARRQPGVYAFVGVPSGVDYRALHPLALFHEAEGITLIVEEDRARTAGWAVQLRAAWLTLTVQSDLHAVGLTAAVATALADAGIACNVVAAVHPDHLFVPVEQADAALGVLAALQRAAAAGG